MIFRLSTFVAACQLLKKLQWELNRFVVVVTMGCRVLAEFIPRPRTESGSLETVKGNSRDFTSANRQIFLLTQRLEGGLSEQSPGFSNCVPPYPRVPLRVPGMSGRGGGWEC